MADNNVLTNGQPDGSGRTSTSPSQAWDAGQNAISDAEMARQATDQRAVEATNAAARNRATVAKPSAFEATGNVTYNAHGTPALPTPKAKGKRGK